MIMVFRKLIFLTFFSLISLHAMNHETGKELIKIFTANGNEALVPLTDIMKKYGKEVASQTIQRESPSILKSTFDFIMEHPKGILQTFGYSCFVAGILWFRYSRHYWTTPEKLDEILEREKVSIIHTLQEEQNKDQEGHRTTAYGIQDVRNTIFLASAAFDKSMEETQSTLESASNKALKAEMARRKLLKKRQNEFYNLLNSQADAILLNQKNFDNDMASKQETLAKKHTTITYGISSLNNDVNQELQALETAATQQSKKKNIIHTIEASTKKPVDLEEAVSILDHYGCLHGQVLSDVQDVVKERKRASLSRSGINPLLLE